MAKGEKISRALGSLSEGLVRQADIGGVMYKEAATKEAARKDVGSSDKDSRAN